MRDAELLKLDIECSECGKKPIKCRCEDKWLRLRMFKIKLLLAEFRVGYGGATHKQHLLYKKFSKYI